MSDIPSASDIRAPAADNLNDEELAKWRAFTRKAIAAFIYSSVAMLNNGEAIHFNYPTIRDRGRYARIWNVRYPEFIAELTAKGYTCSRDLHRPRIVLAISL